jgi:hypothetical protein
VGQRHALGPAGRARRVEDDGEVVVAAIDGRERVRLAGDELVPGAPAGLAADQDDRPVQPSILPRSSGAVTTTVASESARM